MKRASHDTEQSMGIKVDGADVSPTASTVKAAPTAGGVTSPGVLTVAEAIRRILYLPMASVVVRNFYAPLPEGCCYATPQDRVRDLILAAEKAVAERDAMQAVVNAASVLIGNDDDEEQSGEDDDDAEFKLRDAILAYRATLAKVPR